MKTKLVPRANQQVVSVDFGQLKSKTKVNCRKILARNSEDLAFEYDPRQDKYTVNVKFVEVPTKKSKTSSTTRNVPRHPPREIDTILPKGDDWGYCAEEQPWESDSVIEDRKLFGGHFHESPTATRQHKYLDQIDDSGSEEEELDYVEKRFRQLEEYEPYFSQVDILDRNFTPRLKTLRRYRSDEAYLQYLIESLYSFITLQTAERKEKKSFADYVWAFLQAHSTRQPAKQKDLHQALLDLLTSVLWFRDNGSPEAICFDRFIREFEGVRQLGTFLVVRLVFIKVSNIDVSKVKQKGRLHYNPQRVLVSRRVMGEILSLLVKFYSLRDPRYWTEIDRLCGESMQSRLGYYPMLEYLSKLLDSPQLKPFPLLRDLFCSDFSRDYLGSEYDLLAFGGSLFSRKDWDSGEDGPILVDRVFRTSSSIQGQGGDVSTSSPNKKGMNVLFSDPDDSKVLDRSNSDSNFQAKKKFRDNSDYFNEDSSGRYLFSGDRKGESPMMGLALSELAARVSELVAKKYRQFSEYDQDSELPESAEIVESLLTQKVSNLLRNLFRKERIAFCDAIRSPNDPRVNALFTQSQDLLALRPEDPMIFSLMPSLLESLLQLPSLDEQINNLVQFHLMKETAH